MLKDTAVYGADTVVFPGDTAIFPGDTAVFPCDTVAFPVDTAVLLAGTVVTRDRVASCGGCDATATIVRELRYQRKKISIFKRI